ncbi:MAG: hypothetical protein QM744_14915 [Mesorhizobium sp.]
MFELSLHGTGQSGACTAKGPHEGGRESISSDQLIVITITSNACCALEVQRYE